MLAWDHGLHPEVVDSKLHHPTGATGEFTRLSSGRGGISTSQRVGNPSIEKQKKKKKSPNVDALLVNFHHLHRKRKLSKLIGQAPRCT